MQYSTYPPTTQGKFPKFLPQKTKIPYRRYLPPGGSTATPLHLGTSNTHSFLLCLSECMSLFLSWWFSLVFSAACAFTLCFIPLYLFAAFGFLSDYMMDSDNSSSASLAGKVHSCHCGKRISSLKKGLPCCMCWLWLWSPLCGVYWHRRLHHDLSICIISWLLDFLLTALLLPSVNSFLAFYRIALYLLLLTAQPLHPSRSPVVFLRVLSFHLLCFFSL